MHDHPLLFCQIIEPKKVQESVNCAEGDLMIDRMVELPGIRRRDRHPDQDLSMFKGDHIRRRRVIHELPMDLCDRPFPQ